MIQLLRRNVKRFRGGLVFKAHRLVYHSTLSWRVIKKKKEAEEGVDACGEKRQRARGGLRLIEAGVKSSRGTGGLGVSNHNWTATFGWDTAPLRPHMSTGAGTWLDACRELRQRAGGLRLILNLRTTTSQKCEAVPRRARI